MTREEVLQQSVNQCLQELYSFVEPKVEWNEFIEENKIYSERYRAWEKYRHLLTKENKTEEELKECSIYSKKWDGKSITECIGPRPYEFYYLPKEVMKEICDSYVYSYKLDSRQELLDTIEILKNYCKEPVVDKYIEGELREDGTRWPGHRGYDHPDNLEKELRKIFNNEILPNICKQYNKQYNLQTTEIESSVSITYSQRFQNKFFEFLDMAGKFYNWTRDLNTFNMSVYLGPSPNSNKQAVIDNWKEYRDKDIEINEEQMLKDYYGDED